MRAIFIIGSMSSKKNTQVFRCCLICLLWIFLLSAFSADKADCAEGKKRILVLHSYHQGLEWTDNITDGIKSVYDPVFKKYEIHYEYLDTKRNSGKEYSKELAAYSLTKNRNIKYDVIIVSDNTALNFIRKYRRTIYPDIPVVFCGINNFKDDLIDGMKNVTGVVESTDHKSTIDVMQKIHPERNKIFVILDNTPTGKEIRAEFRGIEEYYKGKIEFEFYRDFLLKEVESKVADLGNKNLIYILTINRDRNNNFVSYHEGIEMVSRHAEIPIYGSWDFYLGKGIVGGKITSGFLQGQHAANLALRILKGESAEDVDIIRESPTEFIFDFEVMKKHGINISQLPEGSSVINQPKEFYEKYRSLVYGLTVAALISIIILLRQYRIQKSTIRAQQRLNEELEKRVLERTNNLENANAELERISSIDGLTQLYNRRYFDRQLEKEINNFQRLCLPISLLMCDIDYFKKYNDTYGHVRGDDCIRTVVGAIERHCRRISDTPARFGGEEFIIILPNTKEVHALAVAESIRRDVEECAIPHSSSPIKKTVSISIGVATVVPDAETDSSAMIALADKALYESKKNGRDRVTLSKPLEKE